MLALQKAAGNRAVAGLLASGHGNGSGAARGGGSGGGGGGGGGAVKPSTFGTDVAGVVAATSAAQDQAGDTATSALAAATIPTGPPVVPAADVPDPPGGPAMATGSAGPAPPTPAAAEGSLATAATTSGLSSHEGAEGQALSEAGGQVAQQAAAVQVGALGPTQPVGHLPSGTLPPAAGLPDSGASQLPTLEPEVAEVLDQGFGGELSGKAAELAQQREQAVADHRRTTSEATAAHDTTVAAEQAAAEDQNQTVQQQAQRDIAAHKSDWAEQGRQATAAGRSELRSLRSGASADVERQAGEANSQAGQIMTTARDQASEQQAGPAVQRSLWGRIRSAAGRAIGAARDGLSSLAGAARGLVEGALSRVRGLFDSVRQAIADRIGRYVQAARDLASRVRARLSSFAQAAMSGIRRAVSWARDTIGRISTGLRALGGRLLDGLRSALRRAAGWLADRFRGLVNGLLAAGRFILSLAGKVRQLLRVASSKVLKGIVRAVEDPAAFVAPYKAQVGRMVAAVPAKAKEMYDTHVAHLFGGGETPAAAGPTVQRQPEHDGQAQEPAAAPPSHGEIVWEYLKDRFAFLGSHWGSVILDALLEILVPGVALYRHLPPMLKAVWQALKDLFAGRVSDAVDQGLKAARELMAILAAVFAQVSIAVFIIGSVLGTPIVGEGAMLAVGLGLLAADAVVQVATIVKSRSNLDKEGRTVEQLDTDYGNIADSVVSLGITLALILIAAVGQKLGKSLLARFPRVGNALVQIRERLVAAIRKRTGIGPPPVRGPVVDTPNAPARATPATDFPGRAGLSASEQLAFDRTIAARRANGTLTPEFEARLKTMSADELRRAFRRELDPAAIRDAEAQQAARDRADATNTSPDKLDPTMAHTRDEGGGVRSRWNETPPSADEIAHAQRIARDTGEPVELFGDAFQAIDGTIGRPPRPLQLKNPPQAGAAGAAEVYRLGAEARHDALRTGFSEVEVRINAPNVSRAELAAEFARRGNYVDGHGVRRIVVDCSDGVFVPSGPIRVTPPIHVDGGGDDAEHTEVPAGAGR